MFCQSGSLFTLSGLLKTMNNLRQTVFTPLAFSLMAFSAITMPGCATPPETSPLSAPAGEYVLDPTHTSVIWSLSHAGLSNYTARFDKVTGALDFDPENPENSQVDIRIDPKSVNTGIAGFDNTIATSGRYFDGDNHPEIRFISTDIKVTGERTGLITGDLTLRGVTKPVTLDTVFNGAGKSFGNPGETLGFSATTEIMRSDWGMTHLIKLANIGDKVTLRIETEFNESR